MNCIAKQGGVISLLTLLVSSNSKIVGFHIFAKNSFSETLFAERFFSESVFFEIVFSESVFSKSVVSKSVFSELLYLLCGKVLPLETYQDTICTLCSDLLLFAFFYLSFLLPIQLHQP